MMPGQNDDRQRDPPATDPTCQQVTDMLVEYVAGELDTLITQALQAHFRDCEACLAFLHTYQTTIRLTRSYRYEDIPLVVRDRMLSVLRSRITDV